jgi:hypothetical protein
MLAALPSSRSTAFTAAPKGPTLNGQALVEGSKRTKEGGGRTDVSRRAYFLSVIAHERCDCGD